ncbi:MAG TPA: hypothetical protein DCP90_03705 [Clostridiales bacterium]|nr:MAG: hypothetical protein A2Y22_06165 [Clostridiales bacterium GWD2_32_59]HAN09700.1 hypothetical protein [Clostridiales bacterium]
MSKAILQECLSEAKNNTYAWELYFFKIDRRRSNQYESYKIRFRYSSYLSNYAQQLLDCMLSFYIDKIDGVEEYNGFNTKVSCDKLLINNDLIRDSWNSFETSIATSNDDRLNDKDRYNGYVLVGCPQENDANNNLKSVTFIKVANPLIKLETKKSLVFKNNDNNELDTITDDICRLYFNADSLVINDSLYNFNHSFEKLFNIEQTLHNVKDSAIQKIIATESISDNDCFANYLQQSNSRTFISMNEDRVKNIEDSTKRRYIGDMLGIEINTEDKFVVSSLDEATSLIKYLCYKIVKEADTNNILEASSLIKRN